MRGLAKVGSRKVLKPRRSWPRRPWHHLPDDALLAIPVGRLDLKFDDTPLATFERQLRRELEAAGLARFHPFVYLGDEWFSPVGVGAISVPFFLADLRMKKLARRYFVEVEGGTSASFMRLLRHEAGHAFDHAYELSERADWRRMFGDPDRPYRSRAFRADPSSPAFVHHLDSTYAQAHPTEDFAETFATVVTPRARWRERYKNRPEALAKLTFVAGLIARHGSKPPRVSEATLTFQADRMRRTLGEFLASRADANKIEDWDRKLRVIFPEGVDTRAHDFLKKQKPELFSRLGALPVRVSKSLADEYDQMVKRARYLGLASPQDPKTASLQLAALLGDSLLDA